MRFRTALLMLLVAALVFSVAAFAGNGNPGNPERKRDNRPGACHKKRAVLLHGAFMEAGPARVWMRMGVPLVSGEEPTPLQRVLAAADSGNGVSAALDWRSYLFINVDLSVHLHRMPAGEWVCLDAVTLPERSGVGLADTRLHDQRGPIGRALQTLLVDCRSVKVKRLFFFFADRHRHAWLKRLDRSVIDLGSGKRMLVKGGRFDAEHLITVPETLDGIQ